MTDADADKLDAYLGNGTYEKWTELDTDGMGELSRSKRVANMLWKYDSSLAVLSPFGADWIEKVHHDLNWGFDHIIQGKFPAPEQFDQLFAIYPLVIDTASLQLDEGEAIGATWILSGFASIRSLGLAAAAGELRADLLELDALLREAEAEKIETEIKAALGIVINTVGIFLPGLSLLAKGGLTAAEFALADNDTAKKSKVVKFGLESIEHVEKAGSTVRHVARKGAKSIAITGFYFDVEEVLHARKNVKKIKAKLEEARKKYNDMKDKLSAAVKVLGDFQRHLDSVLRPIRAKVMAKRSQRDDMIQRYGYSSITPMKWKIVVDHSRFTPASKP
jgi:hypothetical protein